ncbi:hypothetical protein [Streptomyces poonensis]|uniref:hypothetical protein n=1 Tax=Streptomyces poonensis TaxID=68255 RepID=UPI0016765D2B|nr:hypothetical protein [Streptomyces poonensis]
MHDAVTGHVAWGVLTERDVVAVPGPLDWLRDEGTRIEVLLASAPRNGNEAGFVERIKIADAAVLGLDASPEGAAAFLRLTHDSLHRPVADNFQQRRFEELLAADPDVWRALEGAGAVPPGIRDLPRTRVLGPVRNWELTRRRGFVRDDAGRTVDEVSIRICDWFPTCACLGPWW